MWVFLRRIKKLQAYTKCSHDDRKRIQKLFVSRKYDECHNFLVRLENLHPLTGLFLFLRRSILKL